MTVWLSAIVPVHNGAKLLGHTLAAAAAERPEGIEFLIYDSSDDPSDCREIVERFSSRLALRYEATPECKPWTAKTNRGVSEARGEYVAMLHQDDLWLPGHLGALRCAARRAPGAAMSIAPSRFADIKGRGVGFWNLPFAPGLHPGLAVAQSLIVQNTIAIPAPMIRRQAWIEAGGMDEELWYTADWDMYLKLALMGEIDVRPEVSSAFRLHGGSLTMAGKNDTSAFARQHLMVLERHLPRLPESVRARQEPLARAAITLNCVLASGSTGKMPDIRALGRALLHIGPGRIGKFLSDTRIIDRVLPRLRLILAGDL